MKHPARPYSKEDGEDSDDIGMDIELIPQQGECKTNGTCEVDIEPLLSILALE